MAIPPAPICSMIRYRCDSIAGGANRFTDVVISRFDPGPIRLLYGLGGQSCIIGSMVAIGTVLFIAGPSQLR